MTVNLYWIEGPWPGKLAILPRPRGDDWLEDEVRAWRPAGIDVVVSLLTPDEVLELGLTKEEELCEANGIQWLSFAISDRSVPESRNAFSNFVRNLEQLLAAGKTLAIHCRQGIGRSSLLVAGLLVLSGVDAEAAFARVGAARGCLVPDTREQREWFKDFARQCVQVAGTAAVAVKN